MRLLLLHPVPELSKRKSPAQALIQVKRVDAELGTHGLHGVRRQPEHGQVALAGLPPKLPQLPTRLP
jgi:hypothetical protein